MRAEFNDTWGELGPRIIKLAQQEVDNHFIQDILSMKDNPEDLPEGGAYILV